MKIIQTLLMIIAVSVGSYLLIPEKALVQASERLESSVEFFNKKEDNIFRLYGDFNDMTAKQFLDFMEKLDDNVKEIHIRIDSPGGAVTSLTKILGSISDFKSKGGKVITYNDGNAMSCGFILFLKGDVRVGYQFGTFLCHGVAFGVRGNSKDFEKAAAEAKKVDAVQKELLMSLGVKEEDVNKSFLNGEDNFFSTSEMVKYGLVTEVR